MKKTKEEVAGNAILDKKIKAKYSGGFLQIPPLKLGALIYISKCVHKIKAPQDANNAIQIIGYAKDNCGTMALIVAYAVLNSKLKIKLFARIYAQWILWKLTAADYKNVIELILRQSQVGDFFLSTVLLKQINVMVSKADMLKEMKQSGEPSQVSPKTSD